MFPQTPQKRVLFSRTLAVSMVGVFVAIFSLAAMLAATVATQHVAAATNSTLNFQARLEGSGGNIAPDGYYNVEFKLYNSSAVVGTPDAGACTRNGGTPEPTCLWAERYYDSNGVTAGNDNRVQVRNGYLTVSLGSQTAFGSSINWDQDLWVTLNIGGTTQTASPTWDGEMTPRLKLTGVPYAFRAGALATYNGTSGFTSTLSLLQPTVGNQTFQIQDQAAAGTYNICIQTSSACGFAASSGSANYIQNQTAGQQTTSNFWISGNGRADTALQAPLIDTATATTLNIGTTNASSIALKKDVSVAAGMSITLVGGITSTRPASPTDGMLYYDTTTKQLLVYDATSGNAHWEADKSSSTYVVAASNSIGKDGADYVVSSTDETNGNADAQINAALSAINTAGIGGSVYLMEGTYTIDGSISVPNNTTLTGAGAGTVIKFKNSINANFNGITNADLSTGTNITVSHLTVDGNRTNNTSGTQAGIYLDKMSAVATTPGATINNVTIKNTRSAGLVVQNGGYNTKITNNSIWGNQDGIWFGESASSNKNTVISNNSIFNNTNYGMSQSNASISDSNTFANNTVTDNVLGVTVGAGWSITGNVVSGNTTRGLLVFASYNAISGNKFLDNGGTAANDSISISGNNNTVTGNDIGDTSCTTNCYAININSSTAANNYLANNRHHGTAANPSTIRDIGAGTVYSNQPDGSGNLINRSAGGGLSIGKTTAAVTTDIQGGLRTTALSTPSAPTLTTSGTAQTTTYGYKISALDGLGETLASTETTIGTGNATLTGTNRINISWTPVGGAVQYKVYRTTASGTSPTTTGLISTVAGNVLTLQDTGLAASGAVATANTTGGLQAASSLALGTASTTSGSIVFKNSTNANTVNIVSGATSTSYTLTLPLALGASGDCLKDTTGAGVLGFGSCGGAGSGVTTVGALDGGTANANGATISSTTIYLQSASTSFAGLVNTTTQSFAGDKTFTGNLVQSGSTTLQTGTGAISLNGDVTVAAGKYISLVGGITSTRPASPTDGMLYYDTTTKQLLVYDATSGNTGWRADRKSSTKVVAMGTATGCSGTSPVASVASDGADYVTTSCTSAETVINSALSAVGTAGGGIVYLMEGTYVIGGSGVSISVPNNTTLMGAGAGTVLKFKDSVGGLSYTGIANSDTSTGTRVAIENLRIDGNKANQSGSIAMLGISFSGMGGGSGSTARDGGKINNVIVRDIYLSGSSAAAGIYLTSSRGNTIANNTLQGNGGSGIYVNGPTSIYNTFTGNVAQGNGHSGFRVVSAGSNLFSGNVSQGNTSYGFELESNANNNNFTGNTVLGNGTYGFYLDFASNNVVNSNKIHDTGGATTNMGIGFVNGAISNTVTGNDITDTSCTTTCYAINVTDSISKSNYFSDNRHSGTSANPSTINDASTGTIYANQIDGSGNLLNTSQGGGFSIGKNSASVTTDIQGGLRAVALPTPSAPTLTTSGTAQTTTYGYKISALDGLGETLASTETTIGTGNATLTGTNRINISWSAVGGAVQYKVYRTTASGTSPTTTGLISTVAGNVVTLQDTGLAASGAVPSANTTGGVQGASLDISSAASLSIGATNATAITLGKTTGSTNISTTIYGTFLYKSNTNSATGFQIQNSSNQSVLTGDTSAGAVLLGQASALSGTLKFATVSSANVITLSVGATSSSYALTLPTALGASGDCLKDTTGTGVLGFGSCGTGGGGGATRTVVISPEYGGATISADGSNNNGTLTSDFDRTNNRNYYSWTNSTGALNDYDIVVRGAIPSEYASGFGTLRIYAYGNSTSTANNDIVVTVKDGSGTTCASAVSILPGTANTWTQSSAITLSGCTFSANSVVTIIIQMKSLSNNAVRVGDISYQYTN